MIGIGRKKNMMSFISKPLCIALLLFGQFSLIWLKSNVVTLEYKLSALEKKKAECIKERRMMLAEKAGLQSFVGLETENNGFVLPDRVRVIHVKRQKGPLPYKVSLDKKLLSEPELQR